MTRMSLAFSTLPFVAGVVFQIGFTESSIVKIAIAFVMLAVNIHFVERVEDEN